MILVGLDCAEGRGCSETAGRETYRDRGAVGCGRSWVELTTGDCTGRVVSHLTDNRIWEFR